MCMVTILVFMYDTVGAAKRLVALDAATAAVPEVDRALASIGQLRSWLDSSEARLLARLGEIRSRGNDAQTALQRSTGMTSRAARQRARRADALAKLPATLDALASGELSGDHADVIVNAVTNNPAVAPDVRAAERSLLEDCGTVDELTERVRKFVADHDETSGADRALRQHAKRRGSTWVGDDDMQCFHFDLPPTTGKMVADALVAEAQSMWRSKSDDSPSFDDSTLRRHPQLMADALVALIERATGCGADGAAPKNTTAVSVVALTGLDVLVQGLEGLGIRPRLADGTSLATETIFRLACEHGIIPAVLDGVGADLYLGRRYRLASAAQRVVLEAEFGGCALCNTGMRWCHVHHIEPWSALGPTDIDKLVPLCSANCHVLVHEAGWRIEIPEFGVVRLFSPDGRLQRTVYGRSRFKEGDSEAA